MPKVKYVERTIYNIEGIDVHFVKDGKDVRSDASLPVNYKASRATKNASNVSDLKSKLTKQFSGYNFEVLDGNGNRARGNMLLGTLRDTYDDDTEE